MSVENENLQCEQPGNNAARAVEIVHDDSSQNSFRVDFRQASSHLSQKRPGYYLILLRTEIKHRSLREKRAVIA